MHKSVLLKEVIKLLSPQPNENFIDCTLGEAGHTLEILKNTKPIGKILGIEEDADTLRIAEQKAKEFKDRIVLYKDNFKNLERIIETVNFKNISGILFDLGMSSRTIDDSGRGFTFKKDEPLLMNFGNDVLFTAEEIVNNWLEEDLEKIFREYGEEGFSKQIAKAIVIQRRERPIKTTFDLLNILERVFPRSFYRKRIHPATKVFQALRIVVNDHWEDYPVFYQEVHEGDYNGERILRIA